MPCVLIHRMYSRVS